MPQNIMNEGPGLRSRVREAVVNEVAPELPKATPPQENPDKINKHAKYGDRKGEARIPVDQMTKPLGSFKHGTDYVPETGNYELHKGEAVKTAEENKMDSMALVPGRTENKPKKEIHEIRTRKAKSGGFIHEHHHTHPEHHKMEEHNSPDMKSVMSHMNANMGDGATDASVMGVPAASAAPAAGAPAVAAGAPPVA